MAFPLYSTQFFKGSTPTGVSTPIGTVPAGFVWVLRDMRAFNAGPNNSGLFGFGLALGSGTILWYVLSPHARTGINYRLDGHLVLEPGDSLELTPTDDHWTFLLSGFVLSLP